MAKEYSISTVFKAKDGVTPAFKNMTQSSKNFSTSLDGLSSRKSGIKGIADQLAAIRKTSAITGFATAINGATAAVAAVKGMATAVKNGIQPCIDAASDLNETVQKTDETFKTNSNTVKEWAKNSITNMGLSRQTALDTASLYGDMGTGMGMSTARAAEMSMSLTQLSADMASFKNVSQDITGNALKSVFTGETETLKNLGVIMTQENLQAFAAQKGYKKKLKDMTQSEKIELRYAYVMDSTKNSHGDFLRTLGGYANQQRVAEELKNEYQQRFGEIMLPAFTKFAKLRNDFLSKNMNSVVAGFGKVFNYISKLVKLLSPVFTELKNSFKGVGGDSVGMLKTLTPIITKFVQYLLVPALIGIIKTLKITYDIISAVVNIATGVCKFIKNNLIGSLFALSGAIVFATYAIGNFKLQMALAKAKGGLFAIFLRTGLGSALKTFATNAITCFSNINKAMLKGLFSPTGLIIAGVALLIGGVILLWKNWDKVSAALKKFWNWTKDIGSKFVDFFKTHFTDVILTALGPFGILLQGLDKLGAIKFPQIELNPKNNAQTIATQNNYRPNGTHSLNGKIGVAVTLNNRTQTPAEAGITILKGDNLSLATS